MSSLPVEVIEMDRVRLRPYREADAADLVTGLDDPQVRLFLGGLPAPYTRADALDWITRGAPANWARGWAAYAIVEPATDRVIGGCGLSNALPHLGQVEIGYWVAAAARGQGVATAATKALTGYAFGHGYARVELLTRLENAASQRVAIGAGFHREGLRRGARPERAPGTLDTVGRADRIVWARLADDPAGPSRRLLPDLPGGALTDGVIALRPPRPGDEEFLHHLYGLPDVVASSVPPVAPDREEIALRVARSPARWLSGERADLVLTDAATGEPAGSVGLYYSEPSAGQGMVGYSLLPRWRGRGWATRAVFLVAAWAFEEVGLARLVAGTAPDNAASQRVLARAGFHREGLQRDRLPGLGRHRLDEVQYALLPADLPARPSPAAAADRPADRPAGAGGHRPAEPVRGRATSPVRPA